MLQEKAGKTTDGAFLQEVLQEFKEKKRKCNCNFLPPYVAARYKKMTMLAHGPLSKKDMILKFAFRLTSISERYRAVAHTRGCAIDS